MTSIFTVFICSSLPPFAGSDDLTLRSVASQLAPLNNGFMRIFSVSYESASVLSVPATFATAFGFVFGYSRVILSMARSGLFPPCVSSTYGEYKTPVIAILLGSVLSYCLVLLGLFIPIVQTYLFNVCILAGFTAYIAQLAGFILFRIRHPDQERLYVSPLGIPGAVFGMAVFGLSAVSVIGFQNDNSIAFVIYLTLIGIASVYYFGYAKSRQYFSAEEKFIFVLQIIKCKFNSSICFLFCFFNLFVLEVPRCFFDEHIHDLHLSCFIIPTTIA
jgi:ethanolamine permease